MAFSKKVLKCRARLLPLAFPYLSHPPFPPPHSSCRRVFIPLPAIYAHTEKRATSPFVVFPFFVLFPPFSKLLVPRLPTPQPFVRIGSVLFYFYLPPHFLLLPPSLFPSMCGPARISASLGCSQLLVLWSASSDVGSPVVRYCSARIPSPPPSPSPRRSISRASCYVNWLFLLP